MDNISSAHTTMKYITKKELADVLNISAEEILNMVRNREISFYKFGYRTLRFDLEEVKRWIQSKKVIPIPRPLSLQRKAG